MRKRKPKKYKLPQSNDPKQFREKVSFIFSIIGIIITIIKNLYDMSK
ncbi:hypothetical protein [Clostridium diolis]|nr:hypothetical protein [Clostridium diolis]